MIWCTLFSAVAGIIFIVASIPSIFYTLAAAFIFRIRLKVVDELNSNMDEHVTLEHSAVKATAEDPIY